MDYKTQSDREALARAEFASLPETMIQPFDRRYVAARGLVLLMQDDGVVSYRMSDDRFTRLALWIAAGMKEACADLMV